MNIAHLISSNGLFGAEKVMLSLASKMKSEGTPSWIFALRNLQNPHFEIVGAAQRENVPCRIIRSKGRFDFSTVPQIVRLIRENNIDLLHTHNYKSNFLGLLAAKKVGIPVVATLHGYLGESAKVRFYEAIDRGILKFFARVILVDKGLEKWFLGRKNINPSVINNGVSVSDESVEPAEKHGLTIGTVGRLSREKGHRFLLEAFAKLVQRYPETKLLIVGDGPLMKSLKVTTSQSHTLKDRVIFAGFQADVASYYKKMDIYVSSSLIEHFPLSILEAMSFGKAVIATNVGSVCDLIKDSKTGCLVHPGSANEIYDALVKLSADRSLRDSLGAAAREYVKEHFSLDKMVSAYQKIYQDVLAGV